MTIETNRMINEEISTQMSGKPYEIRSSMKSQTQDAINMAITEKVPPSIQNTLYVQVRSNFTVEDRKSGGLKRSPGAPDSPKTWDNHPKSNFTRET